MRYRKYELGSYDEMVAKHRWEVPERYNIALDVCDKHERDRLAMIWEDWRGRERRVTFGELQDLSNRFANVLEAHGGEGDRDRHREPPPDPGGAGGGRVRARLAGRRRARAG